MFPCKCMHTENVGRACAWWRRERKKSAPSRELNGSRTVNCPHVPPWTSYPMPSTQRLKIHWVYFCFLLGACCKGMDLQQSHAEFTGKIKGLCSTQRSACNSCLQLLKSKGSFHRITLQLQKAAENCSCFKKLQAGAPSMPPFHASKATFCPRVWISSLRLQRPNL